VFARPYLENTLTKRAGGVAQGVGPEFKPQYKKKYIYIQTHICVK
jgi:hypothetical protein